MKLYADRPARASFQLAVDVLVVLWIAAWIGLAAAFYDAFLALGGPGRTIEQAGSSFSGIVSEAGRDVEDVPVIGEELRGSFESIAEAGSFLQDAGRAQQDAVATAGRWLAVLLAGIPTALVLIWWLPWRIEWIRESSAARRIRSDAGDLRLFALRALAHRPLRDLRSVSSDPAGDYERGRYDELAALELGAMGLRTAPRSSRG
jgi:hypothetical protein